MEYWKPIKGHPNYEVSNLGNVRSLNWHNERIVKNLYLKRHNKGYLQVELTDGKTKRMYLVHRLVAQAFLPNPNRLPQVNHIDENKANNSVSNLEWCTGSQNMRAYYLNHPESVLSLSGPSQRGRKGTKNDLRNTFPIKQLDLNGNLIKVWAYAIDIRHAHNYNATSVWECCEGKRRTAYGYKWQYDTSHINE